MLGSKFSLSIFSLVLLTFFLSPKAVKTQNLNFGSFTQDLEYGFTAGTNFSSHLNSLRFDAGFDGERSIVLDINPANSLGLFGGFFVRNSITESIRVQAEPVLTGLGARYSNQTIQAQDEEFEIKGRTRLLYMQIPVTVHLTTAPDVIPGKTIYGRQTTQTTYHALAGLYWGFLLNATFSGNHNASSGTIQPGKSFTENINDHYYRHDGGFIIGGGLEHGIENKFGVELRASISPFDTGKDWDVLDFNPKNMGVSLAFYYKI